ncbi:hypothetical protein [Amycolatopsis thailandensis]|uniref:hypothetical protein n=1 Tax=Amycolatopsis thailandensis TaxID=589330 RepID=UPI0036349C69
MQSWQIIALAAGPAAYGIGYFGPWLFDKIREPFRDPRRPAGPVVDRRTYRLVQRRVARLVELEEWNRAQAGAHSLCAWLRQKRHEGSPRNRERMNAALATWTRLAAEYDPKAELVSK